MSGPDPGPQPLSCRMPWTAQVPVLNHATPNAPTASECRSTGCSQP
jgi:hypothetical protein